MLGILLAQDGLISRNAPVDTKRIVQDTDATISLRMIELIAFILEHSCFREYRKTMGKALGDKELAMIFLRQFYHHMLTIRR